MLNFNEEDIRRIIKKELDTYLSSGIKEVEVEIPQKRKIAFLGTDEDLKQELEKYFFLEKGTEILVVSNISLKNMFNLSNGIYDNEFEEHIIMQLLENKKVILIEEGLEHLAYPNIAVKLLEKYKAYIKNMKDYGIIIQKKSYFLKQILTEDENKIYSEKLLDLKKIKNIFSFGTQNIIVSKNTIITGSAMDYAKENNITVIKRSE